MNNNLIVLPIIIPVIIGLILIIFKNNILFQRILSFLALLAVGVTCLLLIDQIEANGIQTLHLGGWEAPFGISLVADMFAVILVFAASIVSICILLYSFRSIGIEREMFYFYPLFLFLLAGVNGSFLTGDIFNLFVCFEVMLVASYVLISLGGTKIQLRESIKYILINMISSFLFLVGIALLYATTGTLNMAHLSVRIAEVGQEGLMTSIAFLFLVVFSLKAGLFLFFWLPGSYSVPPTAISALFASLLTKVGIYAIIRVFSLIFYHEPETTHFMIGILAAATMILGAIGAVAYRDIKKILTYNVVVGVGFILAGFAAFTSSGLNGTIYYLIHDMIAKGLIFLLGGATILLTGTSRLHEFSGLIRLQPALGWMFFIASLSLAGIPPLSGFVGKIFITKGTFEGEYFWLGLIGLFTSLMVLFSLMKIFMNGFWGYTNIREEAEKGSTKGLLFPMGILTALTIFLGIGVEFISPYVELAAENLLNPNAYIEAVFNQRLIE